MKQLQEVLKDLKSLIGEELNAEDIICAFEDFEDEDCECGVIFKESENVGYDYISYVNKEDSTNILFQVDKIEEDGEIREIISDVWEA